jgi:hypothetical protein
MRLSLTSDRPPVFWPPQPRRPWRRAFPALPPATRQWSITDQEIRVSGDGWTRTLRWPGIVSALVLAEVYLLQPDGGAGIDVPFDALTEEQDNELRAFLAGRGLIR